jgi:hypothetical protein
MQNNKLYRSNEPTYISNSDMYSGVRIFYRIDNYSEKKFIVNNDKKLWVKAWPEGVNARKVVSTETIDIDLDVSDDESYACEFITTNNVGQYKIKCNERVFGVGVSGNFNGQDKSNAAHFKTFELWVAKQKNIVNSNEILIYNRTMNRFLKMVGNKALKDNDTFVRYNGTSNNLKECYVKLCDKIVDGVPIDIIRPLYQPSTNSDQIVESSTEVSES